MSKLYQVEEIEPNVVKEVAIAYGFSKDDMASILGVSEKTFYNIMQKSALDQERSDRFQFIQSILESGEETFGTKANFSSWLNTPQPTLEGFTPKSMMSTITGANKVLQLLGRIKHGITA